MHFPDYKHHKCTIERESASVIVAVTFYHQQRLSYFNANYKQTASTVTTNKITSIVKNSHYTIIFSSLMFSL